VLDIPVLLNLTYKGPAVWFVVVCVRTMIFIAPSELGVG
jgi:hypothetical protein